MKTKKLQQDAWGRRGSWSFSRDRRTFGVIIIHIKTNWQLHKIPATKDEIMAVVDQFGSQSGAIPEDIGNLYKLLCELWATQGRDVPYHGEIQLKVS